MILAAFQKYSSLKGHKVAAQYGLEWLVTQDNPQPQPRTGADNTEIIQLKTKLELMTDELKELKQQLQGASFRNGYLEAQMEGRDRDIKLLTDSQHKRGWWAKFSSWFMTGR
jgi:hypothetical protein